MDNNNLTEFENIYKENFDKLYKVAFRITGNKEDAEDSLQEAYLNAYKSYPKFKGESSIGVWLYRITINSSIRYIKKIKRLPVQDYCSKNGIKEVDFFNNLKSLDSVENNVLLINVRETCLQLFINCMPKKQRVSFILKVLMDISIEDVSKILGISKSAVKINVHRSKMLSKNLMEGRCSLINPKNPCSCASWVNYAVKYDKINEISNFHCSGEINPEIKKVVNSEFNFIGKLSFLYKSQPETISKPDFIQKMKKIIIDENLKIFK